MSGKPTKCKTFGQLYCPYLLSSDAELSFPFFWIVTAATLKILSSDILRSGSAQQQSGPGDLQSEATMVDSVSSSLVQTLTHEATLMRDLLSQPIQSELVVLGRGYAIKSNDIFCIEIFELICRFGYNEDPGTLLAGQLLLDIMVPLQRRVYEGLIAADTLSLIKTHAESARANGNSYLVDQALGAGLHNHTALADPLGSVHTMI